nr:MAG TPA: hypothetical protein [Caudoviricetes sp.]
MPRAQHAPSVIRSGPSLPRWLRSGLTFRGSGARDGTAPRGWTGKG